MSINNTKQQQKTSLNIELNNGNRLDQPRYHNSFVCIVNNTPQNRYDVSNHPYN
jgi:hypothetical protein